MALISHERASFSLFLLKKRHRIPAADILSNDIADTTLNCIPVFKYGSVLFCTVVLQQSFKHVFMRLNGLHKAFLNLEVHVSEALGR